MAKTQLLHQMKMYLTDGMSGSQGWLRRWLWYSVFGIILFNGGALLHGLLFAPTMINDLKIFGDVNNVAGWFVGVLFILSRLPQGWWRSTADLSAWQIAQRRIPIWVALVFLLNGAERGVYLYYYLRNEDPSTSWPVMMPLFTYPFFLLALFALFRYTFPWIVRLRLVLDGCLILTALMAFCWYFFLGQVILDNQQNIFERGVLTAYPLVDLILCFYLLHLYFYHRNLHSMLRFARSLFLWGLLLTIVADFFNIVFLLQRHMIFAFIQGILLCLGTILIAFAVQALASVHSEHNVEPGELQHGEFSRMSAFAFFFWRSLLPSACVPIVLLLMGGIWLTGDTGPVALGVNIAGFVLITLLVFRQILILYETFLSHRALEVMQVKLAANNYKLNAVNVDLEEKKRELELAYQQQQQANKLKDQFLLSINHELRTPLTEMHGYLELLDSTHEVLDVPTRKNFIAHALNGSQELLYLVNSILETLRSERVRETLHKEHIYLAPLVKEVIKSFDARKVENYELDLAVPAELTLYADQQCIRQILFNLLANAFKYSPPNTKVSVSAQMSFASERPSAMTIWVQDAGPGIPPESQPFLFNRFFRLPRHQASAIRGTGLGLSICKQLVEAMDGRIWVESSGESGEGSRFSFTVPIS